MTDDQNTGGALERLRNSPRTVSTIIVILIIAGAIFAFSDRGSPSTSPSPEPETKSTEEAAAPAVSPSPGRKAGDIKPSPSATPLPQASETSEGYTEVAESGQGVTHLARKATGRYLEANKADFTVTNEHRVYIEDYIKDRVERMPVRVGDTRMISKELIREAVSASQKLSDAQLKNLQQYSRVVRW